VVEKIAQSLNVSIPDLISKPDLLERVKLEGFQTETVGVYTLTDIKEELKKPGRDPRDKFVAPQWRDDVKRLADLNAGMILEGVVTNVTNFGAFVDIGVHQDGLVHVSELSTKFIKDPNEAVKVGQLVKVKVLSVDQKAKRIALSIKQLQEPRQREPKQAAAAASASKPAPKPQPQAKTSLQDQLARLNDRFRTR
jgi:uncharacterized protein